MGFLQNKIGGGNEGGGKQGVIVIEGQAVRKRRDRAVKPDLAGPVGGPIREAKPAGERVVAIAKGNRPLELLTPIAEGLSQELPEIQAKLMTSV